MDRFFFLTYNSIVQDNFYFEDYIISYSFFFDSILEMILVFFIFYNLITLFNDKKTNVFQYHKWLICFYLLFFIICFKFLTLKFHGSTLILGFSWLSSFYVLFSKLVVVTLTILILWIIQRKVQRFNHSENFIEFPLVIGFSLLFMLLHISCLLMLTFLICGSLTTYYPTTLTAIWQPVTSSWSKFFTDAIYWCWRVCGAVVLCGQKTCWCNSFITRNQW